MTAATPLLELSGLTVHLAATGGPAGGAASAPGGADAPRPVLDGIDLTLAPGEALGLVGESGSGKSMTVRAVTRLLPPGARLAGGVRFEGRDVTAMSPAELRGYRDTGVGLVFQDPRAHINPTRRVGAFLTEALVRNRRVPRRQAEARAAAVLAEVGIDDPARRLRQYPHELSGGMLQRVMIASVLLAEPRLILADEPTTALDVTIQAEVVSILDRLRRERGLGMVFITHDLDLALAVCGRVAVMYAGRIVEIREAAGLHQRAAHPYTLGLLGSRPSIEERAERLSAIPGRPVSAFEAGPGCAFADRCGHVRPVCREVRPELEPFRGGLVRCHRAAETASETALQEAPA
ncbi:ABC transporter ATP-binding protein [Streptacidiphilus sp. PB12-B1b]|uniref:ABC transporter ATP-binding protein n=1 Tax=Streptacidiphilus sp. PB12-B1b TaxID=2705012 RepID=UPI0015FAA83F|nr:ABC transporter ATP-binding protein [Streptacidiphilus sp. PB12-B1b]QMU76454.1 ABC transporter ATP-binding protein [Streptacidiphilus sp. PB12-B1b]